MTTKHAAVAAAIAAVLAAPVYAQSTVINSSGASMTSSTGVIVTPGAPSASVAVVPSTSLAIPTTRLLPGGATVQSSATTVLGGPAGDVSGTQTVTTRYWVNVPPDVEHRSDFQRWMRLKS